MNMATQQQGHDVYKGHHEAALTNRQIDSRALTICADRLQRAVDAKGADMKEYAAAIRHNQRLWTIFQVSVCDPDNPLPQDLKVTLLSLSRYVDKVSFRTVTEFLPEMVESLININRIIAVGLQRNPEGVNAPAAAQPTVQIPASIMTSI